MVFELKFNKLFFREMEMIVTVLILVFCYAFCAVPKVYRLYNSHQELFDETPANQDNQPYRILLFIPYLLQFGLNSVVYALSSRQYMKAYKAYIKHIFYQVGFTRFGCREQNKIMSFELACKPHRRYSI